MSKERLSQNFNEKLEERKCRSIAQGRKTALPHPLAFGAPAEVLDAFDVRVRRRVDFPDLQKIVIRSAEGMDNLAVLDEPPGKSFLCRRIPVENPIEGFKEIAFGQPENVLFFDYSVVSQKKRFIVDHDRVLVARHLRKTHTYYAEPGNETRQPSEPLSGPVSPVHHGKQNDVDCKKNEKSDGDIPRLKFFEQKQSLPKIGRPWRLPEMNLDVIGEWRFQH
ncbi:MAG: hypothetical protein LBL72_03945 [Candidatus Accumulibacter sp.]|jgi:hypothetical protein|nr:hypothetical protein [Accumulibacter sp.]